MPSPHSGSSHSSSSHSGSSRSGGSSGGSFRSSGGPSSHSSSSHSSSWSSGGSSSHSSSSYSGSRSSSSSSWGSSRSPGAPSRHSGSSRSSVSVFHSQYVRSGSMRGEVIPRTRVNQPRGFFAAGNDSAVPDHHYCVRHNYDYYPFSWTDAETGREYKKGYYDENGEYYEDVAFLSNGKYKDVLCRCEYCDTVTKLDWQRGGPLICPQCGGSMKLLSALDEYTRDPGYEKVCSRRDYVDYADLDGDEGGESESEMKNGALGVIALFLLVVLLIAGITAGVRDERSGNRGGRSENQAGDYPYGWMRSDGMIYLGNGAWGRVVRPNSRDNSGEVIVVEDDPASNVERFGSVVRLKALGADAYRITEGADYDREMVWDEDEESYCEAVSELWLWYNTDVTPPLWQYWYEPISGNYGDCGWMEYEAGSWYIEVEPGQWVALPTQYDSAALWHIEE